MHYDNIAKAVFLSRRNRFIAEILINGEITVCHLKNTGRLSELLIPGAGAYVQKSENPSRKTAYDLIGIEKDGQIVNIDSSAPNKVFSEWVKAGGLYEKADLIKPECTYKSSRFDFYIEAGDKKAFVEVKGVSLLLNGAALFPDAPSIRALKHVQELIECTTEGYEAWLFFIIAIKGAKYFTPNRNAQPKFCDSLIKARDFGVNLRAIECECGIDYMTAGKYLDIRL